MKAGGGKRKGGAFERQVCKDLSLWLTGQQRTDIFWRAATSGGRATVQYKRGVENITQVGDISAVDPLGDWLVKAMMIECKHVKTLGISSLVITGKGELAKFWAVLLARCRQHKKLPMIVAQQNGLPRIVVTNTHGADFLKFSNTLAVIGTMRVYAYSELLMAMQTRYGMRKTKPSLRKGVT